MLCEVVEFAQILCLVIADERVLVAIVSIFCEWFVFEFEHSRVYANVVFLIGVG